MRTKPYSAYKRTGNEWLTHIPKHWELLPLRQIGRFLKGAGGSKDDAQATGLPCIRYGDLYTTHRTFVRAPASYISPNKASQYTRLQAGDALFAASGETIDEIGKSAVNLLPQSAYCGGDVIVLRPGRPMVAAYLGYALDCRPVATQKSLEGRGITVMHVYPKQLKNVVLPIPSIEEQKAIARFLDRATGRIDGYIRGKENLIALLEERERTLTHAAVTGRLDVRTGRPYSGYEDSEIVRPGAIPNGWTMRRLRSLARISTGGRDTIERVESGRFPFFVRSRTVERIDTWSFDGEAVLTAGDGVGVGKVFHYMNGKFDYHQRVYMFSEFKRLRGRFFYHQLASTLRHTVAQGTAKSTVDSLRLPMLQNFPVLVPPFAEQDAIVEFVDNQHRVTHELTERAARAIDLMRQYRNRLIADAVTGNADVRGLPTKLANEVRH